MRLATGELKKKIGRIILTGRSGFKKCTATSDKLTEAIKESAMGGWLAEMSDNYLQKQERATRRREIEMSYRLRHRKAVNLLRWAHIHWNEERQDLERRLAAAEEKARRLKEQAEILERLKMPCHEWVNGQVREVELPLMEVFHRLAFGCPGTDTHLGVTSVETPDAQAAAERWPVVFTDPPASPSDTLMEKRPENARILCDPSASSDMPPNVDARERAWIKAAVTPSTNQRPSRQRNERQMATGEAEATVPGEAGRQQGQRKDSQ